MKYVVALGGNALLKRSEPMTSENQRKNVRIACEQLAKIYNNGHQLVVTHGNGPQVGLLALQSNAYKEVPMYPLDVLGAESIGMIGYMVQQEMVNFVPKEAALVTVLTQTEVDPKDPAFKNPTKPVGPVYTKEESEKIAAEKGWVMAPDNDKFRRVVPSPLPKKIFGLRSLKVLVEAGHIVVCAGGGGVPTYYDDKGELKGSESVIDKDLAAALLASEIDADVLIIATDVNGVYIDWMKPTQKRIAEIDYQSAQEFDFAKGSMGPKVAAAINFVKNTGHSAVIGSLDEIDDIIKGKSGTKIVSGEKKIVYAD